MTTHALLPLLLLVPLLGGLALTLLPRGRDPRKDAALRWGALALSLLTFAISIAVAAAFLAHGDDRTLRQVIPWVPGFGLSFGLGLMDSVSLWLVLLTTFLQPLVVLGSFTAIRERAKEFYVWLMLLEAAMLGVFLATDLVFFYVCFEFTLVPMYFLIGVFGSHQRLRAARMFFLYTFTGSMLTLAGVLYVAWFNTTLPLLDPATGQAVLDAQGRIVTLPWTFDIRALYAAAHEMSPAQQTWVLLALLAGFAVKVPLWPVHTWLPLAHTEAPTAGSVILAGVLLKLGTYGLLRFAVPMFLIGPAGVPGAAVALAPYIAAFAVIGILYTALVCWVQRDFKKLIAYSSVSHLGFCVLGLFALNPIGMSGSVLYMINHGLSTGALFLCVGMVYERFHTREMADMSGLARVMPIWACFLVFFALASVGLPGLNGFVSEFLCLLGAFDWPTSRIDPAYAVVAAIGMIFGAIYIFYMLGRVVWGPLKVPHVEPAHAEPSADAAAKDPEPRHPVRDLSFREIIVLLPLAAACLYLGFQPQPLLRTLQPPLEALSHPTAAALDSDPNVQRPTSNVQRPTDRPVSSVSSCWKLNVGRWTLDVALPPAPSPSTAQGAGAP